MSAPSRIRPEGSKEPFVWRIDDLGPVTVKNHELRQSTPPTEREVVRVRDGSKK